MSSTSGGFGEGGRPTSQGFNLLTIQRVPVAAILRHQFSVKFLRGPRHLKTLKNGEVWKLAIWQLWNN